MNTPVQTGSTALTGMTDVSLSNNSSGNVSAGATNATNANNSESVTTSAAMAAGWLYKWTNYLKGYRKRWFVLQNGELSYYRNQIAVSRGAASRGTILLYESGVRVGSYERDALVIVLTISTGSRIYLKTPNEAERARWFSALCKTLSTYDLQRNDMRRGVASSKLGDLGLVGGAETEAEDDVLSAAQANDTELNEAIASPQRDLDAKVTELQFCIQMLAKQQTALNRDLSNLSNVLPNSASSTTAGGDDHSTNAMRALNERGSLMRVTATTALRACDELASLAAQYGARYRRLVEHERAQRHSLETLIEQLARQHRSFEKQARKTLQRAVAAQQSANATSNQPAAGADALPAKVEGRTTTKKVGRSWLKRSSHQDSQSKQARQQVVECPSVPVSMPPRPVSATVHATVRQNTMPSLMVHSHSSQQLVPQSDQESSSKRIVGSATHTVFMRIGLDEDEDDELHFVETPSSAGGRLQLDTTKLLKVDQMNAIASNSNSTALSKSEQNLAAAFCVASNDVPSATLGSSTNRDRDLVDFNQPTQFDDDSDDDEDEDEDDDFFDALDTSPAGSPSLNCNAKPSAAVGMPPSVLLIEAHQRFQSQNALARARIESVRDAGSAPSTPAKRADDSQKPPRPENADANANADSSKNSTSVNASASNDQSQRVRANTHAADSRAVVRNTSAGTSRRVRRGTIAPKPSCSVSLWSILKNCVGKELSRIPMPVNFSEPISLLQRFSEDFEYSSCLDRAALASDPYEALAYVAAFTVSPYCSTINRTTKPFNPLLGETFEMDRSDEPQYGWRLVSEQVSHHPPAAALHCESANWTCFVELTMTTKFRGKYIQIQPYGVSRCNLRLRNGNVHQYSWSRVTTTVHNIIVGRLWIDQHGEMEVRDHTLGIRCQLKYAPYSYFSRDVPRKVTGAVYDTRGNVRYVLDGTWDEQLSGMPVFPENTDAPDNASQPIRRVSESQKPRLSNTPNREQPRFGERRVLWRRNPLPRDAERMYNFTQFAIELNEFEPDVAPTDSRRRPDQRLMENGEWEAANVEKIRLEEKQRAARKRREMTAQLRGQTTDALTRRTSIDEPVTDADVPDGPSRSSGAPYRPPRDPTYKPRWFDLQHEACSNSNIYMYAGRYWQAKTAQDWSGCPDIF